jgi:hypothetical protein
MTTLLIPALLLLHPTAGTGGDETSAPGFSLKSLAQSDMLDDMRVGGLLRASLDAIDDELSAVPNEDVEALRFEDIQLWFSAQAFGYDVFVKLDAGEATAFPANLGGGPTPIADDGVQSFDLREAWIRKALGEYIKVTVGQYKCPLLMSASVGDGNLAMIDRTRIGYLFSFPGAYQPGVAVVGDYGHFHAKVSVQNGADSQIDGLGIVVRGEYRVGEGAKQREGALGNDGFNATVGVGYFKDDSDIAGSDFGSGIAVDAYTTFNQLSLHAEVLDADEELASRALGNVTDDATPYDATLGFLFTDEIEAFARYQDLDNEVSSTVIGGGLNYYVSGHKAKWQLNVSQYDDDNTDGLAVQLGFSIGESDRY